MGSTFNGSEFMFNVPVILWLDNQLNSSADLLGQV